jgi:anti-sigma28 factor (negative regulator of flagellin synthesis)
VLVSIAQVILAYIQTQEAHKKNVDASNALRIAVSASEDVNKASVEAKRMVAEIKNILDGTEKKVAELDRSIQDGNRSVMELQLLTRFNTVVIAAQSNDRDAYDQLWNWGDDASFPYREITIRTVNKMMSESGLFFPPDFTGIHVEVPWSEDPNKLTLPQLIDFYNTSSERIRLGVVQFIWLQRLDISKKERLQFLADILKDEKSLFVCKLAGYYFAKGTGDGLAPLGIRDHLKWWEKNKETIK